MEDGDYTLAVAFWNDALGRADPPQQATLRISLARAYIAQDRQHEAIALLAQVITKTVPAGEQAEALGLLAGAYESLGEWRAAIDAFSRYLDIEDAAAPYVQWHIAKAYEALEEDEQVAEQLVSIDLAELPSSLQAEILEELASARRRLEDYDGALEAYQRILDFAKQPNYRALVLQKKGQTLGEAGQDEEALELFRRVLQGHPESYAAYLSLVALDELEAARVPDLEGPQAPALRAAQVSDLERGQILYHARQYAECIKTLERYALAQPEGEMARAHYTLGLAHERLGQYSRSFQEYDAVIKRYPQDPLVADAWMAKARAAAAYGGDPSGLYFEFWRLYPDHPRAPEALWLAGTALEREGRSIPGSWEEAAEFYHRLRINYPEDTRASEALFREGLAAYVSGNMSAAHRLWAEAVQGELPPEERTRLLTWLGLAARASEDAQAAQRYWQEAMGIAPQSYYGLRARDLSADLSSHLSPYAAAVLPGAPLSEVEWSQIAAWITSWHTATEEVSLDIAQDLLARRGTALWRLGWVEEAVTTYRLLRDKVRDDPRALLVLTRLCDQIGLHPVTISCAQRLEHLGGEATGGNELSPDSRLSYEPPKPLLKLSYPTTFGHLVSAQAAHYAVDPLLFLALVRQESRFNPHAVSYAGAVGLTQVMPDTGTWIASRIGPESYRREILYRPVVSVRYGMWLMHTLLDLYDRDWIAALVAYNAGPGNLKRWTNDQPITDHDLFVETLPVKQAEDYVKHIYQQYRMYEKLYR